MNTIWDWVIYGLDPDQDQRSVGPDLGPNCLQRLSADEKTVDSIKERVNQAFSLECCVTKISFSFF